MSRRTMTMKNSSDIIGDRTPGLPACRAVPQPTASPRAPTIYIYIYIINKIIINSNFYVSPTSVNHTVGASNVM